MKFISIVYFIPMQRYLFQKEQQSQKNKLKNRDYDLILFTA